MFSCFFCLFLQIWDSLSLRKPRPNDQSFYGQLHENHNDFHTYYFRACPACPSSHDGAESRGPTAAQPSANLWWSLSVIFAESSKKWFAPDDSHTKEASAQYKTSGESASINYITPISMTFDPHSSICLGVWKIFFGYFLGLNLFIFFVNYFCLQNKLFMLMAVVWF